MTLNTTGLLPIFKNSTLYSRFQHPQSVCMSYLGHCMFSLKLHREQKHKQKHCIYQISNIKSASPDRAGKLGNHESAFNSCMPGYHTNLEVIFILESDHQNYQTRHVPNCHSADLRKHISLVSESHHPGQNHHGHHELYRI